jgi:hypothetical protein
MDGAPFAPILKGKHTQDFACYAETDVQILDLEFPRGWRLTNLAWNVAAGITFASYRST